jgi:glycerophosphoryl diester phosphodiesterase
MTLVIAHRGASAYAPENTLPAFDLAVRQGADMIELDVQRSADGALVVFHDDTTVRWDGRQRPVATCSLSELRALDIGGARIATLAETCAFAREHNVRLNVELKRPGMGHAVAQLLRDERVEDLVLISSFWPAALLEMAEAAPHIPHGYLMGTRTYRPDVRFRESWPFRALRSVQATAWHPAHQIPLLSPAILRARRLGYQVNVWTVNDVAVMRRMLGLNVDGIITDTPDVLRKVKDDTVTR